MPLGRTQDSVIGDLFGFLPGIIHAVYVIATR